MLNAWHGQSYRLIGECQYIYVEPWYTCITNVNLRHLSMTSVPFDLLAIHHRPVDAQGNLSGSL